MKNKWLNLILHVSSRIQRQKNKLQYAGLLKTLVMGIYIIFLEIILSIVSLPMYFFIVPAEEKELFGENTKQVKTYRLRKRITLGAVTLFLLFEVVKLVIAFSGTVAFPFESFAADGSGTTTVAPLTATASSTGNTFTFTSTAAELMDSGELSITVPAGWSTPQGVAGTAGYVTATSGSGIIANVINALNSTANWTATQHMTLAADTGDKPSEINPASVASLSNTITAPAGANEQWYFNNGAAQNWGSIDNEVSGLRIGMFIKSSIATTGTNLSWRDDDTASLASPLDTVNIAALTANTWTYTSVTLGSLTRNSILSYGLRYTTDIGAAVIKLDNIATLFDAGGGSNWSGDSNISVSTMSGAADHREGTTAIRCTYAAAAGTGTNGDCYRSQSNVVMGPGTSVGFWVRSSVNLNAGDFAWTDDGNTTISSPEDIVNLPAMTANTWNYVVINATNSANKTARSWGVRQLVDKGAMTIDVDAMGKVVNTMDTTTGWTAPTSTVQTLSADTSIFHEGATSLKNVITAAANAGNYWYQTLTPTQNWSTYTTVGFWIRSTVATSAGNLQFSYASSSDLSSPIASINIPALTANTWTYVKLPLTGTRTVIGSYGITYATDIGAATINLDDVLAGPGSPTFSGNNILVRLLALAATQNVVVTYGTGGGTSGVTAPSTPGVYTFTTKNRVSDSGTLTNILTSPTVTVNAADATPPVVTITAPTKTSNATITNTTINVTDNAGILAAGVTVHGTTTAGTSGFSCTQTNATTVNCTINITSSGNLVISATDIATNNVLQSENGYVIESTNPVITITAPTKTSNATITNTTIQVTDNNAINAASVTVHGTTTAGTSAFSCTQAGVTTVNCTINITSSGNLVIAATDVAGNSVTKAENGYVIETTAPVTTITAPTKTSNTTITDTTIQVTDNNGILAANVIVHGTTTAGTSGFSCTQTNATTVNCTINITGGGNLVISATDNAGNNSLKTESGYVIDPTAPVITITAPTKTSNATITNTTINVTDNLGILAANVTVNGATTAGTSAFSCTQTNATTVNCTINITSSGNLVIRAVDNASNAPTQAENGYIIETTAPVITITAPTKNSGTTITNTTIQVVDNNAVNAANVTVHGTTTAGTSSFSCTQAGVTTVNCTINITSSGNLVIAATDNAGNSATQAENNYIISSTPPVITITAPTKTSNANITDTTINVTDPDGITVANVTVHASTTAGTSGFNCTQTSSTVVDCTINITGSGNLVIRGQDNIGNAINQAENGYVIETTAPVITITAPTKNSSTTITNTTIQVVDNNAILAANVTIDPSTTAGTSSFSCTQAGVTTVNCTINITSSGNLVIAATDNAGNSATQAENGYVINSVAPTITITAPTKTSNSTITNTTVNVTDPNGVSVANVTVHASTTAGTSGFNCTQTSATVVDCTINITSSGNLVIHAQDSLGNAITQAENGYIVETTAPVITITAPTKNSGTTITNTTVQVVDNNAVLAANVTIDPSTTAGTSAFSCTQAGVTTVNCTINITSSGNLVIAATDNAGNTATQAENNYIINAVPPTITITAPTKTSNANITDTTVQVTDADGVTTGNVTVHGTTTAGNSGFSCTQTNATTVNCTITITSSGNLVIRAEDNVGNAINQAENGYIIETTPPVATITAPTKTSNAPITNTTIQVTDNNGILVSGVTLHGTTTAGTSGFSCTQTSATIVNCTITITSSGNLVISATDNAGNNITQAENGYVIETSPPVITFNAPTKTSNVTITNTTIQVTDNNGISTSNVNIHGSTTAGTANFICNQTIATSVSCTIDITSSGDLVITAADNAGNTATNAENNYIINTAPPTITITAPTKTSNATITNTTIQVSDSNGVTPGNVTVHGTSTAGTGSLNCIQTSPTIVDCTIHITSSGNLVIAAVDNASNSTTQAENGYIIETVIPVITINAPTKISNTTITNTTIQVTDNNGISTSNVNIDGTTTAGIANFICNQTIATTVTCTIDITSSGDLVIVAVDDAGNDAYQTETGYIVNTTPPVISINAPTKVSNATITNTTIQVSDSDGINTGNVTIHGSSTATTSNFVCTQVSATSVTCTIHVTSSGNLVITATDNASNIAVQSENGYIIETTAPTITVTAPIKTSNTTITNTTIQITDNNGVSAANIIIDPSTTVGTSNFSCVQTSATEVNCTIHITSSGSLVIKATDNAGNITTETEAGYIVETVPPSISFIAPTKLSNGTITDTIIQVTDNVAISTSNVNLHGTTTAGTANFICNQVVATTVTCTIDITSSGNVVVTATDNAGNTVTQAENNYIIEAVPPTIVFTAPTKTSNATITDTTIQITDNNGINAANVVIDGTSTAGTSNFSCTQVNATTVTCTVDVTSSGKVVVTATDNAGNQSTQEENNYIVEATAPVISFTAPTKTSNAPITSTIIHVNDNIGVAAGNVSIHASTTAANSSFSCSQASATSVNCTITITSSGNLVITATDNAGNSATEAENNYVIETVPAVITINAPTKTSNSTITGTTIQVNDNNGISAANVSIHGTTSAGTSNFSCTQVSATTVSCTIHITSSGSLVIAATDNAGNANTKTESGFIIESNAPTISFTAPTKVANSTISNTIIEVTDDNGVTTANVALGAGTTAGTSGFSCSQTNATTVTCNINITSSGNVEVTATDDAGNSASQAENNYVIETTPPSIVFTAPTKKSGLTITNTTIQITDNNGITAANVAIHGSSTAGTANFSCTQTSATVVSCTIDIVSSGDLVITATDNAGNASNNAENGYIVEAVPPVIVFTAPTKTSNATITNTTIVVTDNDAINTSNVNVHGTSTASIANLVCTQTVATSVSCTIQITGSGNLVIIAEDDAGNTATQSENNYVIETVAPTITITAPTKTSNANITDTTIKVTDNNGINVTNVAIDATSTVGTANLSCTQTSATEVNCTIDITSSGDLVITATDNAGNITNNPETGYIVEAVPPVISFTAPTKTSNGPITDTVITITDNAGISAANISIDPSTTASNTGFACTQVNATTVTCTVQITGDGNLAIKAIDNVGNTITQSENNYLIETTPPSIVFTAPTKTSNSPITNTTIEITDNNGISASNVVIDPSNTAGISNFSCVQVNATTVACTIQITGSGDLIIKATDNAGNTITNSETGYTVTTPTTTTTVTTSGGGGGGGGAGGTGGLRSIGSTSGTQTTSAQQTPKAIQFTDISNHWGNSIIQLMAEECGVEGYVDPRNPSTRIFKPNAFITRAELLAMTLKCADEDLEIPRIKPFPDVELDEWHAKYVHNGKKKGIVSGFGDGLFKPNNFAARAEALKIVLLTSYKIDVVKKVLFDVPTACRDIENTDWFISFFRFAMKNGIVKGYEDSKGQSLFECRPGNNITRAEAAKIIYITRGQLKR